MSNKKEYNFKTRRWEEPREKTGSLKKPTTCRGGRPHNFERYLPFYYRSKEMTQEEYQKYDDIMDKREEFDRKECEELKEIGIIAWCRGKKVVAYKCTVCGKLK